ncbi:substrate-binding domain-containing protein [Streptomyces sp. NPDC057748]|uniref:substrate-binding domain-containing protein n=1 Tax=unclassified Streptomyces TaxID=2593676 RepID=UPI0036C80D3D
MSTAAWFAPSCLRRACGVAYRYWLGRPAAWRASICCRWAGGASPTSPARRPTAPRAGAAGRARRGRAASRDRHSPGRLEPGPGCRRLPSADRFRCPVRRRVLRQRPDSAGAESVLRESGRRVPGDVALVGVDNCEYVISGRSMRHLTTVETGLAALGATAAAQVADGRDAPGTHAHPCTLVVGATTAGPGPEG